MPKGVCWGEACSQAISGETVELYPGPGEFCPECGERLHLVEQLEPLASELAQPTVSAPGKAPATTPVQTPAATVTGKPQVAVPPKASVKVPPSKPPAEAPVKPSAAASVKPSATAPAKPSATVAPKPPATASAKPKDAAPAKPAPAAKAKSGAGTVPVAPFAFAGAALLFVAGAYFLLRPHAPVAPPVAAPVAAPVAGGAAAPSSAVSSAALTLCGSNTIGAKLASDLVRGFLSSEQARDVNATSPANDEQAVQGTLNGRPLRVQIAAHGSSSAFTGLRSGDCQIGMAARQITTSEAAALLSPANKFAPAAEHVIGLDAVAVIVNPANAVWSLSVAQLRDVFSGKTTSWRGLAGGSTASIDVLAGDDQSETYDSFKSLVLENSTLAASARRFADGASLAAAVAADPNAIGFVAHPDVNQLKVLRLSSGGFSVAPSPENIKLGTYPLTRRLFMYTPASPQNPMVTDFIRFVQSDAGQKIVSQDGFVPAPPG